MLPKVQGVIIMNIEAAKEIRSHATKAIENLSKCLDSAMGRCNDDDFEKLRKAVGLSIMKIDSELIEFLDEKYPELDDLK